MPQALQSARPCSILGVLLAVPLNVVLVRWAAMPTPLAYAIVLVAQVTAVGHPNLGLTLDLGHLYLAAHQCRFDFLEAIRQMRNDVGRENVLYIHLTLMPYLAAAGELVPDEAELQAESPPRPPAFVNGGMTPRVGGVYQGTADAEIMSSSAVRTFTGLASSRVTSFNSEPSNCSPCARRSRGVGSYPHCLQRPPR